MIDNEKNKSSIVYRINAIYNSGRRKVISLTKSENSFVRCR